ncbi:MAG: DedA family protein [Paracoccaceae bacterium]|nr:DedA family protein [Paracoccaceae bacterium]MDG2259303.1 DedA family protein [Paracoccaceae bacterium]
MTEVITLVTTYGAGFLFLCAFLSCLLVPIPTSLMMITAGAFVATEDLLFWQVYGGALLGAILGDQTGFLIGKMGGARVIEKLSKSPSRKKVADRAVKLVEKHGGVGVFFSTWLFAPLGPWVNFIAGSMKLNWLRFTIWDTMGETIWVTVYISFGYVFASNLTIAATYAGNTLGAIAAAALAGSALFWIIKSVRAKDRDQLGTLPAEQRKTI